MTTGSHELALTIINDGDGYTERKHLAEYPQDRGAQVRYVAQQWLHVASDGAKAYDKAFGTPNTSSFTVEDILLAAIELADYYAQHVKEL
jgi:hypothetical protein